MSTTTLGPFKGLDLRDSAKPNDGYLVKAKNLVVRPGGKVERRPAMTWRLALPSASAGLYAVGDQLRSLAPSGTSDAGLYPTISLDYIDDPTDRAISEVIGAVGATDATTLSLVKFADGATALHHSPQSGVTPSGDTTLSPGFTAIGALVRAAGRAFTLSADLKFMPYSALEGATPTKLDDWAPGDLEDSANYLSIGNYAAGQGSPLSISTSGGRVIVFYKSAILAYRVYEDRLRNFLEFTLNGPGCTHGRTAVEVGADTLFLSESGVRLLSVVERILNSKDDPVGGMIDSLALQLAANLAVEPVAHYARRFNCYLLAFGQDVLCLSLLPGSSVLGWTTWRLPVAVDAFAESNGTTWVRSGNNLFSLDDDENRDETADGVYADIPVLLETVSVRNPRWRRAVAVSVAAEEPVQVQVITDARPGLDISEVPIGQPMTFPAAAPEPVRAWVANGLGRTHAVRVYDAAAQAGWSLENLWLEVQ